jgi:hypothetical protein
MLSLAQPFASPSGRQQPCTYYQVLGISPDEQDPRVIEEAALGRSGNVRAYQLTRESDCVVMLNEIAQALITLLDPARRRDYDRALGRPPVPAVPEPRPAQKRTAARGEGTLELLIGDGGACDVQLVYRDCAP